jgi:hypothetical protein
MGGYYYDFGDSYFNQSPLPTKQFGKYTVSYVVFEYADKLYQHQFEVALTGTLERTLIEHITKSRAPDISRYFENYYDCIQPKHWYTKGMNNECWQNMINELAK